MTKKQKIIAFTTLGVGIVGLIAGLVFLIITLTHNSTSADGEYLVAQKTWTVEGEDGVIWEFTEIGKGTLTTNSHVNDYDFIWALEEGKLKMETQWLYEMENVYDYQLDHNSGTLTLENEGKQVILRVEK